jgi:hypothetical protein
MRRARRAWASTLFFARDGNFVAFLEIGGAAEIAGHEKIEDRPQIEDGIFERSASENEAMLRADRFYRLGVLRLAIFDVLRFVEHDGVEFDSRDRVRRRGESGP